MEINIEQIAQKAKISSRILSGLDTETKNLALEKIAQAINANKDYILSQNNEDLKKAKVLLGNGEISQSIYDRLKLSEAKFNDMVAGIFDVKKLEDPVNKTLSANNTPPTFNELNKCGKYS